MTQQIVVDIVPNKYMHYPLKLIILLPEEQQTTVGNCMVEMIILYLAGNMTIVVNCTSLVSP